MALKVTLEADIKSALLAGEKPKAEVLKSLKSAILYEEVALKLRDQGLSDEQILVVFGRESKKRAESAELYKKGGDMARAESELNEKAVIDTYLPKQLSDAELEEVVNQVVSDQGTGANMGQIISAVKAKVGQGANGGRIAAIVKSKLNT